MKKFLKNTGIGCVTLIGLFITIGIIGAIFSSDSEILSTTESSESKLSAVDSSVIKKRKRIKDSLAIVKREKRERAVRDLKSFKKKEDDFEESSIYREARTPYYTNVNFIYPYIVQKGDNYWLRLRFQYASDDWLFIDKGTLLVDGEKFMVNGNWERDNNSGIWEWLDISVTDIEHLILEKIANSTSAKIRYIGTQYHNDRTITRKEKSIIKKTLEIYDNLK